MKHTQPSLPSHLRFFWYHATGWGPLLAAFVAWHEWRGERKYGLNTVGIEELVPEEDSEAYDHANHYHPLNYYVAERLLAQATNADKQTAFLEVGAGKGRIMAMAAHYGFREIIGLELSEALCVQAVEVLKPVQEKFPQANMSFDCDNAAHYEVPDDVGVIFLFNPFDEVIMTLFLDRVMESLEANPRPLKVLYASPVLKLQWLDRGFVETHHFRKMRWLEASVLEWKLPD